MHLCALIEIAQDNALRVSWPRAILQLLRKTTRTCDDDDDDDGKIALDIAHLFSARCVCFWLFLAASFSWTTKAMHLVGVHTSRARARVFLVCQTKPTPPKCSDNKLIESQTTTTRTTRTTSGDEALKGIH